MEVRLKSIHSPIRLHSPLGFDYTRLESTFVTKEFEGAAFFFIRGALANADLEKFRDIILNRPMEVIASLEEISDFNQVSDAEPECVVPLGLFGEFSFTGHITEHFYSKGSCSFQVGDITMAITTKMVPANILDVPPEIRVRFHTKSFLLWLHNIEQFEERMKRGQCRVR